MLTQLTKGLLSKTLEPGQDKPWDKQTETVYVFGLFWNTNRMLFKCDIPMRGEYVCKYYA